MVTEKRFATLLRAARGRQEGVVVLEDIYDPHNAAAVFRSCEAFGIQRVCLVFRNEKRFNPRRIGKSTSASANKWLSFTVYTSTARCIRALKRQGYAVVATALSDRAEPVPGARLREKKIALLFGNEHRGLSETALKLADRILTIPMRGMVQSLNLSVTVAVFLYELTRQRARQRARYAYPDSDQRKLLALWTKKKSKK